MAVQANNIKVSGYSICSAAMAGLAAHRQREAEGALLTQVVLHVADRELGALPFQLAEQYARRLAQQVAQHLRSRLPSCY